MKRTLLTGDSTVENDLKAFLDGVADHDQEKSVREWVKTPSGQKLLSEIMERDIMSITHDGVSLEIPRHIPYEKMLQAINRAMQRRRRMSVSWRVAAVVIPLLLLNVMFMSNVYEWGRGELTYEKVYVPAGEQLRMVLADGTSVMLNSETTLEYPRTFSRRARNVKVSGEAFFDVTKDTKRPFLVETAEMNVRVLGTKFNLNTVDEHDVISVYLKQGAVSIEEKVSGDKKMYALRAGQSAMLQKSTGLCYISNDAENARAQGWMHKRYHFKDAPLEDLVRHIERSYGVKFDISDKRLYKYTFTINFYNESLDDVLRAMESITPLRCVRSNDQVTIYPADKKE